MGSASRFFALPLTLRVKNFAPARWADQCCGTSNKYSMTDCYQYPAKQTVLYVHAKCGIHTFATQLKSYRAAKCADPQNSDLCIFSVRSPLARLISSWRQYYVGPSYRGFDRRVPNRKEHRPRLAGKQMKRYSKSIQPYQKYRDDPVALLDKFCGSSEAKHLVQDDPHFYTQSKAYTRLIDLSQHHILCNSIDAICAWFDCDTAHHNQGMWPWPQLTVDDFASPAVRAFLDRYYAEDQDLFARSSELITV